MPLRDYDYRDPGLLIQEVHARRPLTSGDVLLILVDRPSTQQRIVRIDRLPLTAAIPHYLPASDALAKAVRAMAIPDAPRPPRHSMMTIVSRRGLTVFGAGEGNWLQGWRYSNHGANAYSGDLILVTEHGWRDFDTGWGGHQPCLHLDV